MSARITEALQEALKLCSLADTMTACRGDDDFIAGVRAKIEAALSTEPGEAKEMVLVPRRATMEMLNAAIDTDSFKLGDISPLGFRCSPQSMFERAWNAMLAAAPLPEDTHHGR